MSYDSSDEGNFRNSKYDFSSLQESQQIFFTGSIVKKSVGEVRNRQRFQANLRQLEEYCKTNQNSWTKKDLVEQPFSDTREDCWSTFPPDCLLSSTDFKYFTLSLEKTDEEKDLLKNFLRFQI